MSADVRLASKYEDLTTSPSGNLELKHRPLYYFQKANEIVRWSRIAEAE